MSPIDFPLFSLLMFETNPQIIAIIIMLLFTFSVPTRAQADPGGVLLGPVFDLFSSIGDVILAGLNAFLVDGEFTPDGRKLF